MTVKQTGDELLAIAVEKGVGAYVLDEIVDRTLGSAIKASASADLCANTTLLDQAIVDSTKRLLGGKALEQAKTALRKNISAAGCGGSTKMRKADFVNRLQKVTARTVQGYPLKMDAVGSRYVYIVKYRLSETQVRTTRVFDLNLGVTNTRSFTMRLHSDGSSSYVGPGKDREAVLTVKRVTPMRQAGWVRVEFRQGPRDAGSLALPTSEEPVPGANATVFVNPATNRVTEFVAWVRDTRTKTDSQNRPISTDDGTFDDLDPGETSEEYRMPEPPVIVGSACSSLPREAVKACCDDKRARGVVDRTCMNPAPAQPVATATPGPGRGTTISITNTSENKSDASTGVVPAVPVVGPVVVPLEPAATPEATESPAPELTSVPQVASPSCPPHPACPAAQSPVEGLDTAGTFFCMTKKTFIIVIVMLVVACCLVSVGYWLYRKNSAPTVTNGGSDFGLGSGMDDLGLGSGGGAAGGGGGFRGL